MTTLLSLLTDIAPPNARGGAIGLYRTFMDIGGFIGPIAFMIVYTSVSFTSTFYLGAAISLMAVLLSVTIRTKPAV